MPRIVKISGISTQKKGRSGVNITITDKEHKEQNGMLRIGSATVAWEKYPKKDWIQLIKFLQGKYDKYLTS
jgi:hypothetical protein